MIYPVDFWNLPLVFHGKRTNCNDQKNGGDLDESVRQRGKPNQSQEQAATYDTSGGINFFAKDKRNSVEQNIATDSSKTTRNGS